MLMTLVIRAEEGGRGGDDSRFSMAATGVLSSRPWSWLGRVPRVASW